MNIEIKRTNRKNIAIEITKDAKVIVRAPLGMAQHRIEQFVQQHALWIEEHQKKMRKQIENRPIQVISEEELQQLFKQSKQFIPERVEYYASLVGVTYGRITIRNQRTRWGSCSSKGNLNFNCQLMRMPVEIIDYVVVHELCHRKEMNHSEKFWVEVEKVLPDYRERRMELGKQTIL